jgi:Cys-rich protein (TIGR01571 family)
MTFQSNDFPAVEKAPLLSAGHQPVTGVPLSADYTSGAAAPYGGHPSSAYLPVITDYSQCHLQMPSTWHSGMCDCFSDMASCCDTFWCAHCNYSYLYNKTRTGLYGPDWWMCCGLYCADIFLKGGAYAFMVWDLRNKLRQRWNIDPEANAIGECCKTICCPGLAACQVYRELTYRGYWPGGFCISNPPTYAMR